MLLNIKLFGGASKLLKYFERNYNPKSIITYADRRFSKGNLYKQIGFTYLNQTKIGFIYINELHQVLNRLTGIKKNLTLMLKEKYNQKLSIDENLLNAGFYKLYDCGNLIFVKKLEAELKNF